MKPFQIGVALSGGGVKGATHAGMLHYLEEHRMAPQIIAGTSAGAIVGLLYAAGRTPLEILDFFLNERMYTTKLVSGRLGLVNTLGIYEIFKKYVPVDSFDALKIPLRVVATDMYQGTEKVFTSGNPIHAVLASAAFPGMFSPMIIDDIMYCDGGILNHFPVHTIREECTHLIGMHLSPNKILTHSDLNSTANILARTVDLQGSGAEFHKLKDCTVGMCPPELREYSTFDFDKDKMRKMFNLGYQYMANNAHLIE